MQEPTQKNEEYITYSERRCPRLKKYVRDPLLFLGTGILGSLFIYGTFLLSLTLVMWIFGPPSFGFGG